MSHQDENPAVVTFNNQNSVLMTMYLKLPGILCLLHDNRIFAFKKQQIGDNLISSLDEQNLLLSLLTTAKFRIMGFLYSGYHLVDNTLFLLIIIMSILNNGLRLPTDSETALFAAIGLEGFYDVMLFTHRYWILQRLSIYIGCVLYIAYFTIVGLTSTYGDIIKDYHELVWIVLGVRFGAFILEELVDIAIDIELHNDLVKLNLEKIQKGNEGQNTAGGNVVENGGVTNDVQTLIRSERYLSRVRKYLNVSTAVVLPPDVEYIGSMFAWGQQSVFDRNVWKEDKFSRMYSIALCLFPSIPAVIVFIPLLILCSAAVGVTMILLCLMSIVTCKFNALWTRNYWSELFYI